MHAMHVIYFRLLLFVCLFVQGEGVMMSYTAQSKYNNSPAQMASVVTGGAIPAPAEAGATTAENK